MYTLAQRLSSHWQFIEWLLGIGIGSVLSLVFWVMHLGGSQRLLKWIADIESSNQNDAVERIMCGFNALQAQSGASKACFDFIGGLDEWHAVQMRIRQRNNCVRRSAYPICAFILFAVAVFILKIFEPPMRSWSALCVAGAAIAFAWLFWTIFPLAYMAWLKGLPHSTTDKTGPHLDERRANTVESRPQR
jgi:hypothetical protein